MNLEPGVQWLAALAAGADLPPRVPRVPLWAGSARIGTVEPGFFEEALPAAALGRAGLVQAAPGREGWQVNGELTGSLAQLAAALRESGRAHAWRDEQLAVTDEAGRVLGTVERAVVRPLGITTFAVHLAGFAPDGRHWVQQRALDKPNDPGLWDTLMGGMVPASDSLTQALERETWEEAGLQAAQLQALRHCGRIHTRRPSADTGAGYVVEYIDWYRCVLPDGVVPSNQDGEVAQFRLMDRREVLSRLEQDEFTTEAALILVKAGL